MVKSDSELWHEQCDRTFEKHREHLTKTHPGAFVAINGNEILGEPTDLDTLLERHGIEGSTPANIYSLATESSSEESSGYLLGLSRRRFD